MEGGLTDLEVSKEQYKGVEKKLSEVDVQIRPLHRDPSLPT